MPAHVRHDLPEGDVRIIDETDATFTFAVKVPKALIGRNRQVIATALEAVAAGEGDADA